MYRPRVYVETYYNSMKSIHAQIVKKWLLSTSFTDSNLSSLVSISPSVLEPYLLYGEGVTYFDV